MIDVDRMAPDFDLECVEAGSGSRFRLTRGSFAGKWLILLFYPRDFSFVCPTELIAFSAHLGDFQRRNCQLLGVSVDSIASHRDWLSTDPVAGGAGPLRFPLAADERGEVARAYEVWNAATELANRGLFIIDPEGILQYAVVHNLSVGRNVSEVLRVMDALQSGGLCPAGWTAADGTVDVEKLLEPGRVLGHYRIEQLQGRGTFGVVFKALDLRLDRTVALKVLKRSLEESREALLAEARVAARVEHPAVCTIYSVDEHDGLPVIAMQFVAGRPLSQLVPAGLARDRFLELAIPIAAGLAAAHRQGVVHGDLKPANVLIDEQSRPCLVDFGLAAGHRRAQRPTKKLTRSQAEELSRQVDLFATLDLDEAAVVEAAALTSPTAVPRGHARLLETMSIADSKQAGAAGVPGISGTPAYMSPEQAAGQPLSTASDVFSLGLVLCEMFSEQVVLGETNLPDLLQALDRQDIAQRVPQAAGRFQPLLAAMLNRDPLLRPMADDVLASLQANGVYPAAPSSDSNWVSTSFKM